MLRGSINTLSRRICQAAAGPSNLSRPAAIFLPRYASSSSSDSVPPLPKTTSTKAATSSKLSKTAKPSSKVNARSSRLLRSQLTPGPRTAQVDAAEASAEIASALESPLATNGEAPAGQLKEALAFATASSYDFGALVKSKRLPADWTVMEDGQVIYIPSWPKQRDPDAASSSSSTSGSGEVFLLRSGAYVTWGLSVEQARRFRTLVLSPRDAVNPVERGVYEEVGEEEMDFVRNDNEITRLVGDVLVLGQAPPEDATNSSASTTADDPWSPLLARLSFSAGLALSARLSSQESSLSTYLSSVQSIPELLEKKGRVPISRRDVVRKMGRLLKLRQIVNLEEGSKVEELDLFWENARMEEHYDSICATLDIETRFRALNEQLDHAENLMGVLRALLTEGSSHRMEVIIIAREY